MRFHNIDTPRSNYAYVSFHLSYSVLLTAEKHVHFGSRPDDADDMYMFKFFGYRSAIYKSLEVRIVGTQKLSREGVKAQTVFQILRPFPSIYVFQ